jgi:NAD(P)-dependent dehydrogenase (short-subunit alcohol dehydrogenase family)
MMALFGQAHPSIGGEKAMAAKTMFITGGAQGIGRATAEAALAAGWNVAILDRDRQALAEAGAAIRQPGRLLALQGDVAREAAVRTAMRAAEKRFGGLDALVNNAGMLPSRHGLAAMSLKEWNAVLGVNLTGAFLCAKHAAAMLARRRGAIVNIASTRALMSEGDDLAYAASKGGLLALTHALAIDLGPAVRVNCISPGWIDTSAWKKKARAGQARLSRADHAQHPVGRVGRPQDIAAAVTFLVGPDSGFATGANFVIDGGMTRKMIYV